MLYDNRAAFENRTSEHCVSGALALDQQLLAASKFDGKHVRVTAKLVEWALPDQYAVSLNHDGSPVVNRCRGRSVLFATDIALE
jgi:hypothetical protein